MIIDAHTHIHPDAKGFGEKYDASVENLINSLENSDVDKAIVLPIYPEIPNKFVADACKKYPDKLIGFASVNPLEGVKAAEILEKDVKRYNLKGLKLHPRLQDFDLKDPRLIPIFQKCAELKIPVVVDAFPGINLSNNESIPVLIGRIASTVPDVNIIIAHAGGYKILDTLFVAKSYENIYLDISYTPFYFQGSSIERDIKFVIKKIGANRCIYGSDHPELELSSTFDLSVKLLKKYGLSKEEMKYILGETINSLIS
ncbi:hypothetical protein DRP44_06775 [candidate division TA06 bacterium]|uniref:Amidohydrolase-related domain-containing protein n=1 Tax=candidate division TA06 bacterium TaxID=2250710 RepID=A0A660S7M4_UNCT6|nr:MAG: hypothetical protein DRP44_06775 [candidate division TA06 bacterium]